ncbi:MAG: two-component system response regulator GlrR [Desulfuromonadales bacterium C00003096]|jgi:two-component system response regulator GlrR|nr:MAG: two-component system response regulator GlrR [Desulfuromonadales bacterium C00003096]
MEEHDKYRLLLVDDDVDLLRLLSIRLSTAGYQVTVAESGEQALGLLPVVRPHLVLSDMRMEGMDGMALFDAIRKNYSALPVIIMTAHGSIPDAVAATRRGVFGFLPKPLDKQELLAEIKRALSMCGAPHDVEAGIAGQDHWRREIITQSPTMLDLLSKAKLAAESGSAVLILGESGSGKEMLARAIHWASNRSAEPFVAVNCGAIPDTLLESELFGHSKGAFTGAVKDYPGLFRSAQGGTLFLDEIGDMPLALQVKLLRVLQEKHMRPVGSVESFDIDVRIISATHRQLEEEIADGNFREDLYYRLNVVSLELPNLACRREDIPLLAQHFLQELVVRSGKKVSGFAPEAMELLLSAAWPGNVRQLFNVVEQAVALSTSPVIPEELVSSAIKESPEQILPFSEARREFEQQYLLHLMQITKGNVSHAARIAGRNRTEFYKLLGRHHIVPSLFKN